MLQSIVCDQQTDGYVVILESNLQSNTNVTQETFQQGVDLGKELFGGQHVHSKCNGAYTDCLCILDNTPPMEAPKTLQQGAGTILVAALDPSIERKLTLDRFYQSCDSKSDNL